MVWKYSSIQKQNVRTYDGLISAKTQAFEVNANDEFYALYSIS